MGAYFRRRLVIPFHLDRRRGGLLLAILILALTGCVDRVDLEGRQDWGTAISPPIHGTQTVGQTFVASQPRLNAVELFWHAVPAPSPLLLRLYADSPQGPLLAQTEFELPPAANLVHRVHVDPIPDSQGRRFYLEVAAPQLPSPRGPQLVVAERDHYAPGCAYHDRTPTDGDLRFRLTYDYDAGMMWDDLVSRLLPGLWLLLPGLALFWAPGYLIRRYLLPDEGGGDVWSRIALSTGLSLACLPLGLLWITQLGGALGPTLARVGFGLLGLAALGLALRRLASRWPRLSGRSRSDWLFDGLLASILLVGVAVRLLAIRDLLVPAWVDSVHHTVVARLIAEGGRVPSSYQPYVAVEQATYHFGFQADVAFFHWLSRLSLPRAMLILGQLLNGLMALQVYLLARWLTGNRRLALVAALVVALISTMPAYYVSWGRYTQLTGLAILPTAARLTWRAVQVPGKRTWAGAILAVAGLTLTHYRMLAFYVCLVGAWLLFQRAPGWRPRLRQAARALLLLALSLLVLMPWLLEVLVELWGRAWSYWGGGEPGAYWDFSLYYVTAGFDRYILTVAALGALVGLWQRRRFVVVILAWLGALFLITNPSLFSLPGEGLTNNTAMLIAWFMPLSILCAYLFDELFSSWRSALPASWRPAGRLLFAGILGAAALYGLPGQIAIVNPSCVFFGPADAQAMDWIKAHTRPEARFLINGVEWVPHTYAGSDGGFWISPLTQRQTSLPPALTLLGEPEDFVAANDLARYVQQAAADPGAIHALMGAERLDYLYVGARGGPLAADTFLERPDFELVYRNERVFIFARSE